MANLRLELEDNFSDELDAFAEDAKEAVLRSGGNAMSEIFQKEAQTYAPIYTGPPLKGRKYPPRPGQLRDSIYHAYDKGRSTDDVAVYVVSWNHAKAPHGYWMENGNARHPAHPFIRPAWESAKARAVQAGLQRMTVRFARLQRGGA